MPSEHVHGISRDPGSGKVNIATHQGLFVLRQVGPEIDLMGFAVRGPGIFFASGHPAAGVDLPTPVGLIRSTDAGATWTVLSRGGQSDFHALTTSSTVVTGFDGVLRTKPDGKTWTQGGLTAPPRTLAAAPDGSQVLATTQQGVLSSTDGGRTWVSLASAPLLSLATWADSKTIVGVTPQGALASSADAGRTWHTDLATVPGVQAVSASRDKTGRLEILVVTDTAILQSRDGGVSLTTPTP